MWNRLLAALLMIRSPLLIALSLMAALIVLCLILCRNFSWRSPKMVLFGLLVSLQKRELYRLSVSMTRLVYTVSLAFCFTELELPHYLLLLLLCVPFDVVRFSAPRLLFSLLNGALVCTALFAGSLLLVYMQEVRVQAGVFCIYLLLELFICLYSAYLTMRDVQTLASERVHQGGVRHEQSE